MPYYLFKIRAMDEIDLVRNLELLDRFDAFRDAKTAARALREKHGGDDCSFKVTFADNQLAAEEQLLEKREQPVLMEHER